MSTAPTPPNPPEAVPLLPCPFCGHDAFVTVREIPNKSHGGSWHRAGCIGCGVSFPNNFQREGAIREWNDRMPAPQPAPSGGEAFTVKREKSTTGVASWAINDHTGETQVRVWTEEWAQRILATLNAAPTPSPDAVESARHDGDEDGGDCSSACPRCAEIAQEAAAYTPAQIEKMCEDTPDPDAVERVLRRLIAAKDEKDANGETPRHQQLKAGAWEEARAALAAMPERGAVEIDKDARLWASAAFGITEAAVTDDHITTLVDQIDSLWRLAKERLDSLMQPPAAPTREGAQRCPTCGLAYVVRADLCGGCGASLATTAGETK